MLTRKNLIEIGLTVTHRLEKEQSHADLQGPDNKARYAARGLAAAILDDLYYMAPEKVRASFNYDVKEFFKACHWPE